MVNACVILDEGSNRFSPTYVPLMDKLLLAKTTYNNVKLFNERVLDGLSGLHANDCYDGRVIAFRNKARLHNIYSYLIFPNLLFNSCAVIATHNPEFQPSKRCCPSFQIKNETK